MLGIVLVGQGELVGVNLGKTKSTVDAGDIASDLIPKEYKPTISAVARDSAILAYPARCDTMRGPQPIFTFTDDFCSYFSQVPMAPEDLHTYTDSSWGSEVRPFGGHVVMLCNGAVQWRAKRVKVVPDSSDEVELAVASRAAKDTVSMRLVEEDVGAGVYGPTALLTDCKAAWDIILKIGSTHRTKYFERTTMLVKRLHMLRIVVPTLVATECMVADALTKPLDRPKLARFRNYMLNQDNGPGTLAALFITYQLPHVGC